MLFHQRLLNAHQVKYKRHTSELIDTSFFHPQAYPMTTTAATNSASTSTPNDSPRLHDNDGASESIVEQFTSQQEQHKERYQHGNIEHSNESQDSFDRQLPSPAAQESKRRQSPDNATITASPAKRATPSPPQMLSSEANTTATTTTTTATTNSTTNAAHPADKQGQSEQSLSAQQLTTNSGTNNNTEQKRPMNAFLLFCKRQRSLVREKYPNLENRGITKILGDWWSKLDKEQKSKYTDLARQHKEAFMKANPDFKWCKTPNVSNINNNINTNNTNNTNNESYSASNQQQLNQQQNHHQQQHLQRHQQNHQTTSATNAELLSMQSLHHPMDIVHQTSNSMDLMLTSRQQLGAPKPPKKRFLERNDSIYVTKNNSFASNDTSSHGTDVVPYISLDQDTLDRVIDKAFSEDSSNSPSGINTCKCSTRTSTNLTTTTSSSSTNLATFSSTSSSASISYNMGVDEPVDFSMNRTINTTRQQIINNLVEKMLSEPSDDSSSFSRVNGIDSMKVHSRPSIRKDNPDDT